MRRRVGIALGAVVAVAAVTSQIFSGGGGNQAPQEREQERPSRPQRRSQTSRPNLVFVSTDDQDNTSLSPDAMPYLASQPHGHWWTADMIYNLSLCCPSRATFLTGQNAHRTGVVDNNAGHLLDDQATLPVRLQAAGYHTCKVGKYLNFWPFHRPITIPPGWDRWAVFVEGTGDGEDTGGERDTLSGYYDYSLYVDGRTEGFGSKPDNYSTDVLVEHALDCLAEAPPGMPFYLDLAFFGPHGPSTPAPRHMDLPMPRAAHSPNFNESDVSDKAEWLRRTPQLTDAQVAQWDENRSRARRALRSVDEGLKMVFDALQTMGVLDNTVVVFTADNANAFGEHRFVTKRCYYEECIRFPLWIRYPMGGRAETRTDSHLVANVDLAPTLADLAGATLPWQVDGLSLVPLLKDQPPPDWRTAVLLENRGGDRKGGGRTGKYWGLRTSTNLYVELDSGERELYDLIADPFELQNQAGAPSVADLEASLSAELARMRPG